ncbi:MULTISPECIES: superoxide dismutase family protein [Cellulomonas]|uniref:superoxide dismutase family protein n=1 Tax=Cellulomonas TaxID=1707 RepID=UPI0010A910DE|nr:MULTISPECIES: superoxide dismutase family protein [Cellulomonas]
MRDLVRVTCTAALAALALAGCSGDDGGGAGGTADGTAGTAASTPLATGVPVATATLQDVDGEDVGDVQMIPEDEGLRVVVHVDGLEPGFHGFHVHAVGECDPESSPPDDSSRTGAFLSAGGHLGADEGGHSQHAGDLPSLYVTEDGTAHLETVTDMLTDTDLLDDDGSAVMVHSGRDNFANVPERYAPQGPDDETLRTGDSGDRVACGVLE